MASLSMNQRLESLDSGVDGTMNQLPFPRLLLLSKASMSHLYHCRASSENAQKDQTLGSLVEKLLPHSSKHCYCRRPVVLQLHVHDQNRRKKARRGF